MSRAHFLTLAVCLLSTGAACDAARGPVEPPTVGDLRIEVRVSGAADGATVRLDAGDPIAVRADTTLVFMGLSPGNHTFTVGGLVEQCEALPPSGTASIRAGDVTHASILIGCGPLAYVLNAVSDDITVIHTGTNTVRGTIPVENASGTIAANPDGRFLYVTLAGDDVLVPSPDTVGVVDTQSQEVVAKIRVGGRPVALAVSDDGARLLTANEATGDVSIVDTNSNVEISRVQVGDSPSDVDLSSDGTRAYVAVRGTDDVVSIDVGTGRVVAAVSLTSPLAVAVSVNGDEVFATTGDASLTVLNPSTLDVMHTVDLFGPAEDIGLTPDGFQALVAEPGRLGVVEIGSRVEVWGIDWVSPSRVAVTPDGAKVYVVDPSRGWVQSLTNPRLERLGRFEGGTGPRDVVVLPH